MCIFHLDNTQLREPQSKIICWFPKDDINKVGRRGPFLHSNSMKTWMIKGKLICPMFISVLFQPIWKLQSQEFKTFKYCDCWIADAFENSYWRCHCGTIRNNHLQRTNCKLETEHWAMWFQAEIISNQVPIVEGPHNRKLTVHCHFYAGGDPAWVMGCWWIILLFIVQCAGWRLLVAQRTEGLPRRMPGNTPIIFRRENSLTVTNKSCSSSLGSWHKMYNCSWRSLGGAPKGPRIISVGSVRVKCTPLRQCVPTLPKRLGRSNGYSGKRGVLMFKSPRKEWLSGGGQALPGGWE